jgi:hypothetical protein
VFSRLPTAEVLEVAVCTADTILEKKDFRLIAVPS